MAETVIDSLRININANSNKAISNLERLQGALRGTATQIDAFGRSTDSLGNWGKNFNANGKTSGVAGVDKLSTRLRSLGQLSNTVFGGMSSAFKKSGSVLSRVANGMSKNLLGLNRNLRQTSLLSTSIKTAIGTLLGIRGLSSLFSGLKNSITMGADLTEIDHIVESVFAKDMVGYVHDWADAAIESFGIASAEAKKYAGTLSAMFQSSGVARADAGRMATDLVSLAGDLSAFYNEDTQTSFEKIKSGLSGMVRPLRAYGIDLSVATLEEYRLAQGIEKSYSAMSQAEKVMLRYQYLMDNTKTQQGDFQRTADSMANAMRTLRAYIAAVQTQLGVGLSAALRHIIILLRNLMKHVLNAATAFATFMQTIFGKYSGGIAGIALEDAAEYADDFADGIDGAVGGLGDASDAAKQLKKDLSVLPFDELNQLAKDTSAASSGGGGGGAGGGGVPGFEPIDYEDLANSGKLPDAISQWGQRIKAAFEGQNWNLLGQIVANGINAGLQKLYDFLDPKKVMEKVGPWIDAFTTAFKSLVTWFDADLLGRTIGRGVNDIVDIFLRMIDGIGKDGFRLIGKKIADAIAGSIKEIEWKDVGALLGAKVMALWDMLYGFVANFPWSELGKAIADGIAGFFSRVSFSDIADTIATALNGAFTALESFALNFPWSQVVNNMASGINTFLGKFDWKGNGQKLSLFLTNLCNAITDFVDRVNWQGIGTGIAVFLQQLPWGTILRTVGHAIIMALGGILQGMGATPAGLLASAFIKGLMAFGIASKLMPFINQIVGVFTGQSLISLISGGAAKSVATGAASGVTAGLSSAALTGAITAGIIGNIAFAGMTIKSHWGEIPATLERLLGSTGGKIATLVSQSIAGGGPLALSINSVKTWLMDGLIKLAGSVDKQLGTNISGTLQKVKDIVIGGVPAIITRVVNNVSELPNKIKIAAQAVPIVANEIAGYFKNLPTNIGTHLGTALAKITAWNASVKQTITTNIPKVIETARGFFAQLPSKIQTAIAGGVSNLRSWCANLLSTVRSTIPNVVDTVVTFFRPLPDKIKAVGTQLVTGFQNGIRSAWSSVKSVVSDFVNGVIDGFRNGFKTHSPSRVTEEIGVNVGKGFANGFRETQSTIMGVVNNITSTVTDKMSSAFETVRGYASNIRSSIQNAVSNISFKLPHVSVSTRSIYMGNGQYTRVPQFSTSWYKAGGLFKGGEGQVIGIAEGGRDEAVLPLEDRRAMARIGEAIASAGGSGYGMSEKMADRIAEKIANVLINTRNADNSQMNYIELKVGEEVLARAVTRGQRKLDYRNNPAPRMA